ncbi:hypothetical protein EDF59_12617 [Novosphingobium sp. ST904]|nr:hypothetical protein EDF59_12617 [Novosphingobium sp. ST904]
MERYDPAIQSCPFGLLCGMSLTALALFVMALLLFG